MTQEQIDSIRERMCDEYCAYPTTRGILPDKFLNNICEACPLNELEASE